MYSMDWEIQFKGLYGKKYKLGILSEVEIEESVENLADVATIVLPEAIMNTVLYNQLTRLIGRGSEVLIRLGYDGELKDEFTGYVKEVPTNDNTLKIVCEDALFLFRVGVPDVELKPTSLKAIAQYLVDHIDSSFTVSCDYDISYEKFVIHQATGFDVLKKLQDETKGNIYFDTANKVLHIHPPYVEKGGDVVYAMHRNVEESSLEYKLSEDKKIEVTVESTDIKGTVKKVTAGTTGGDTVTLRVGPMDEANMQRIAEAALKKNTYDGYEGDLTGWLVPFCKPTYSAKVIDLDYEFKTGNYYVVGVKTSFSESGGKRTVTLGIKIS